LTAVAFVRSRMAKQPWAESDLPDELAAEAMVASCDPDRYLWKGELPFDKHVVTVVAFLMSNRAEAAKLRANPEYAGAAEEGAKRSALPADARVKARDRARRADDRDAYMKANLVGLPREVYLLYKRDIFDVDRIAAILGKPKTAIYDARKRVAEVARAYEPEPESSDEIAAPDAGDDGDPDPNPTDDDDDEAAT